MTVEQIVFFYKEAKKIEMQSMRLVAITIANAVGVAVNGDKDGNFKEFLEMLSCDEKDPVQELNRKLQEGIENGLNIEVK